MNRRRLSVLFWKKKTKERKTQKPIKICVINPLYSSVHRIPVGLIVWLDCVLKGKVGKIENRLLGYHEVNELCQWIVFGFWPPLAGLWKIEEKSICWTSSHVCLFVCCQSNKQAAFSGLNVQKTCLGSCNLNIYIQKKCCCCCCLFVFWHGWLERWNWNWFKKF